jgi:hypothetical protein
LAVAAQKSKFEQALKSGMPRTLYKNKNKKSARFCCESFYIFGVFFEKPFAAGQKSEPVASGELLGMRDFFAV